MIYTQQLVVFCECQYLVMGQASKSNRQFYFNIMRLFFLGFFYFIIPAYGQVAPVGSADWGHLLPLVVSNEVVLCTTTYEGNEAVDGGLYLATLDAEITDTLHTGAYSLLTHQGAHFIAMDGIIYRYSQGELVPQSALLPHPVQQLIAPPEGLFDVSFIGLSDEAIVLGLPGLVQVIETPFTAIEVDYDGSELYAIGEMTVLRISLTNYEITETISFPANHTPIFGSCSGGIILLRDDLSVANHLARFKRFDLHTGIISTITDFSGQEKWLPFGMEKAQKAAGIVYLSGRGADPYSNHIWPLYGMYAARVYLSAGVVELADVFSEVNADANSLPRVSMASSTGVVFGCFSRNGTEPHVFRDGQLEVLRDIYPGFGSSISLRQKPYSLENKLFFTAIHPFAGHSLWSTEGTPESTFPIASLSHISGAADLVIFPETEGSQGHMVIQEENTSRLYSFNPLSSGIELPGPAKDAWEVAYTSTGMGNLYGVPSHTSGPSIGIADDASVAILHKGLPIMLDYAAQNSPHVWQRKLLTFYRSGYVHVHDSTGSPTGSFRFDQNNTSYACMARDAASGKMIVAVKHSASTTYLDDIAYEQNSDGYFLVGLAADASIEFISYFPAGHLFIIEAMKYIGDELFVAGAFVGALGLNGIDIIGNEPTRWQAFVAGYDVTLQNFKWVNKLPLQQSSLYGGAFSLETDLAQNALYVVTGGSNPAENLNCNGMVSHVQIARIHATSGFIQWNNILRSGSGIRPAGLIKLSNGTVFTTGVAYGNIRIEDLDLKKTTVAFAGCSTQRFLLGVDAGTGAALTLVNTDPGTGALPQVMLPAGEGFAILSLTPGEEVTQSSNGTWSALMNLETSVFSPSGRHLQTKSYPTELHVGSGREDFIAQRPVSAGLHPEHGIFLAGANLWHGTLEGHTFRPVAQNFEFGGSIIIQRRMMDFSPYNNDPFPFDENDELVVYPNPADRSVRVLLPPGDRDAYDFLSIYDVAGRRIRSSSIAPVAREFLLDVSTLSPGVYIIRMEGEEIRSGKLLVQR